MPGLPSRTMTMMLNRGHGTDRGGTEVPDDVDRTHRTDEGGGDDGDAGQDDAVAVAGPLASF